MTFNVIVNLDNNDFIKSQKMCLYFGVVWL